MNTLLLYKVPSDGNLHLKIHFKLIGFLPSGRVVRVHALFLSMLVMSSSLAIFHSLCLFASSNELGSPAAWAKEHELYSSCRVLYLGLGFSIDFLVDEEDVFCCTGWYWRWIGLPLTTMSSSHWFSVSSNIIEFLGRPIESLHLQLFSLWKTTSVLTWSFLVNGSSNL